MREPTPAFLLAPLVLTLGRPARGERIDRAVVAEHRPVDAVLVARDAASGAARVLAGILHGTQASTCANCARACASSSSFTSPSRVQSPAVHGGTDFPKFWPMTARSGPPTIPSSLKSHAQATHAAWACMVSSMP